LKALLNLLLELAKFTFFCKDSVSWIMRSTIMNFAIIVRKLGLYFLPVSNYSLLLITFISKKLRIIGLSHNRCSWSIILVWIWNVRKILGIWFFYNVALLLRLIGVIISCWSGNRVVWLCLNARKFTSSWNLLIGMLNCTFWYDTLTCLWISCLWHHLLISIIFDFTRINLLRS
jgi:hypothetical protein